MADGWTLEEAKTPPAESKSGGWTLEEMQGGVGSPSQPKVDRPSIWSRLGSAASDALGWDPERSAYENFVEPQKIMGMVDRTLNVVGAGAMSDPNYRGRNSDGSLLTAEQQRALHPKGATLNAPAPRAPLERFVDGATDMVEHYSPAALMSRALARNIPGAEAYQGGGDNSRAALLARTSAKVTNTEREARDMLALRDAGDPDWVDGAPFLDNLGRVASTFGGGAVGGLISDPTSIIAPGGSLGMRMASQAAVGGLADAAVQGAEMGEGVRDDYSALQTLISAGGGAALVGAHGGAVKLREWYTGRGIDTSTINDADLVAGSLDGSIDPAHGPVDVDAILRGGGADPSTFSSPDAAAAAATRVQAAQARAPRNDLGFDEIARQTAIGQRIAAGEMDPSLMPQVPPRVMPDDVPIIAAPEGNVRADDAGGMAGLERTRAADEGVMGRARAAVDQDPAIGEILNSNLSPQAKMATLWDRLKQQQDEPADVSHLGPEPAARAEELPWAAPTPERAREASQPRRTPVENGRQVVSEIYPDAVVTSNRRAADDPLSRANPNSWHTKSGGAVDVRPIKGMTFEQYVDGYRRAGYDIIEAKNEVGAGRSAWATGDHWHVVIGKGTGKAAEAPMRLPAPREEPFRVDSGFERTDAQPSPTNREFQTGKVYQDADGSFHDAPGRGRTLYEPPMRTGTSDQPFRADGTDPVGQPGFWEAEAQRMQDEMSAKMRAQQEEFARSSDRAAGSPKQDASGQYGSYAQRPVMDGDVWSMTREGYVAGKDGKPVAFRNAKDAATWAAKNKMGGDFELAVWGANSKRVILKRKDGSTYGARGPSPAQGPGFDAATPPAGRSTDGSQRMLDGPGGPPVERPPSIDESARVPEQSVGADAQAPRSAPDTGGRPAPAVPDVGGERVEGAGQQSAPSSPAPKRPTLSQPDALSFIAKAGGIADNEGHDLLGRGRLVAGVVSGQKRRAGGGDAKLPQFAPGGGRIVTKNGMSIDRAGELLHEAGYIKGDRPTTAETLDYLDRGNSERLHHPDDAVAVQQRKAFDENAEFQQRAHDDLADAAPEVGGERAGSDEVRRATNDMAERGVPAEDALRRQREIDQAEAQNPGAELFNRARDDLGLDDEGVGRLADDLGELATDHQNAAVRGLAKHLADLVGDAKVKYGGDLGDDVRGLARIDQDGSVSAQVRRRGDAETVLHEAVHVATLTRYGELVDGAAEGTAIEGPVRDLNSLLERARKAFQRRPADPTGAIGHAMSSTDEFLAAGLTSPTVQKFLKQHNTAGLWGRFVDGVRGILGLDPKYGNLLDRTLTAGAEVVRGMKNDAPRPAGGTVLYSKAKSAMEQPDEATWKKVAGLAVDIDGLRGDGAAVSKAIKGAVGDPKGALSGAVGRLTRFASSTIYSADGSLRALGAHYNAPTLNAMADIFHARAGAPDGTGRTYEEAIDRGMRTRIQKIYDALEPMMKDKASLERIKDLLARPSATIRATPAEHAAAKSIRGVLKETLEYRRAAGEEVGEVTDGYFPRVIDGMAVLRDQPGFLRSAERLYRDVGLNDKDAGEAANGWLARIMDTHAGLDGGMDFVKPGSTPASGKAREFGKAADTLLKDFYETNPFLTLSNYVQGSVRRAEQARVFGKKGAVGSPERAAWEKEHDTDTQWDVMREQIRTELRDSGKDASAVMDRVAAIKASNLGQLAPTGRYAKNVVTALHTWNQVAKMDRATISSLGDLAMGFVRGGPKHGVAHVVETLKQFGRQVAKLPADDAARYSEAIGTANDAFGGAVMAARNDANYIGSGAHNLIDKFYRGIGLQQLTDGGRIAATKTGQRFLYDLAHDLESTSTRTRARAGRYLAELGVKDADAFGRQLRAGVPSVEDVLGDKGFAADYATAVLRYVNQSILMPTRSQKPTWANHPVGSIFFALQGYSYGFKKNVLERVGRETAGAIKHKDPMMLQAASGLVALTALTWLNDTYLRPYIFGSNYNFEDETPLQMALRVGDRAGFLGPLSPLVNAFQGTKYRRSMIGSLAGPIAGTLADGATAGGKLVLDNNPNTNSDERKATEALYDIAIEPAADALAAARLRGPARTAAIFATGNRATNGVIPSDREAFTSAIAGEKE